jgi:PPOX class probable F420-dependent enzyme
MPSAGERLDPVRGYLSEPRCAVLSTLGPDGAPHQAVVHYMLEQDGLLLNGRADRRWVQNVLRDGRTSIVVHDADRPLHWVGIKGTAKLARDGAEAVDDAMTLARRYGEDPEQYREQRRLSFRVLPRRVYEFG